MYLIPKNIKTKKEIFKGFGILECIAIAISFGIGYLFSFFITQYKLKVIFFYYFLYQMGVQHYLF